MTNYLDTPTPIEIVEEAVEGLEYDVLLFEGFENAIVGISRHRQDEPVRVVYDYVKMVTICMTRDGMDADEADEFVERSAMATWLGKATPIILTPIFFLETGDLNVEKDS